MQLIKHERFFRVLAWLFALLLLTAIIRSDSGLGIGPFKVIYRYTYGDDAAHFFLLGTLALLLALGYPLHRTRIGPFSLLKNGLILAVIITIEEFTQLLFPSRTFSLFDISANLAGIYLLGELGAWLKSRLLPAPQY